MDLDETIKQLLLQNIITKCKFDTLMSCFIQMLSDQNSIKYEAAAGILNTVFNDFIEKENINNPLFQNVWEGQLNSLLSDIPGVLNSNHG